MAMEIMEDNFN